MLAGQMSDKHPINPGLVWTTPPRADTEDTVHTRLPLAGRRTPHFLLDTLTAALNCLLELGLRKPAQSWGGD